MPRAILTDEERIKHKRDSKTKYAEKHADDIRVKKLAYYYANRDKYTEYARAYYHLHKDERSAYMMKWRAKNPDRNKATQRKSYNKNIDSRRARNKQRRIDNGEEIRAKEREVYAIPGNRMKRRNKYLNNIDKHLAQNREYKKSHLLGHRINEQNRRAKKLGNGGIFTENEFLAVCDLFGNKCTCCGCTVNITADHVIPLIKGGRNTIDNIQPLCLSCNCSKGSKTIDYRMLPVISERGVVQSGVSI